jgi:hypothetical protein
MEARLKPLVRRLPSETSSETSHVTTMWQLPSQFKSLFKGKELLSFLYVLGFFLFLVINRL